MDMEKMLMWLTIVTTVALLGAMGVCFLGLQDLTDPSVVTGINENIFR